jgi:hypothetical protein
MPETELFPEEVLLAVLHKVGRDVRVAEDRMLVTLFDRAAKAHPELFGSFAKHPYYPDSRGLTEALQTLDLGGAVIRENAATGYFKVGPRTCHDYGASKFNALHPHEQEIVTKLAEQIRKQYPNADGSSAA